MAYNDSSGVIFDRKFFTKDLIKRRSRARNLRQRTFTRVVWSSFFSGSSNFYGDLGTKVQPFVAPFLYR